MSAVWKYAMESPRTVFEMPPAATVVSVGTQGDGQIVLWAEVSPEGTFSRDEWEQRAFNAVNTGAQLPPDRKAFVGTVQVNGILATPIVWHVYEVEN